MSNNPFEGMVNPDLIAERIKSIELDAAGSLYANGRLDPLGFLRSYIEKVMKDNGFDVEVSVGFVPADLDAAVTRGWIPILMKYFKDDWNKTMPSKLNLGEFQGAIAYNGKIICMRPRDVAKKMNDRDNEAHQKRWKERYGPRDNSTQTVIDQTEMTLGEIPLRKGRRKEQ